MSLMIDVAEYHMRFGMVRLIWRKSLINGSLLLTMIGLQHSKHIVLGTMFNVSFECDYTDKCLQEDLGNSLWTSGLLNLSLTVSSVGFSSS